MSGVVLKNAGRREFLRAVPVAAAAGLTIANASLFAPAATGQATVPANAAAGAAAFQIFTAQQIQDDAKALVASPGNNILCRERTSQWC
ncbi:MAG: hypothetical protein WDM87_17125 [Terracidiphilus sp.]